MQGELNLSKYFDANKILSYNAVFNFIESNRNYGKTWAFKKRATKRALRRGKRTIWIRRYKSEKKKALAEFFTSKDLLKFCGLEWYDKETKTGNLKQKGSKFYIKCGNKWRWFIYVLALTEAKDVRGVDDVDVDTIIFDEYTTTPAKYKFFRGNEVEELIDAFYSAKRQHVVKCFFLGNKESYSNPYFNYFSLPELPDTWEGLRTFRNGSVAVQRINNKQNITNNEYDEKVFNLLKGTRYGNYIYNSQTKTNNGVKIAKTPSNATYYTQLLIDTQYLTISVKDGFYYVKKGYNKSLPTYSLHDVHKDNHYILTRHLKKYFSAIVNAYIDARIYYASNQCYEIILTFYKWLSIITP